MGIVDTIVSKVLGSAPATSVDEGPPTDQPGSHYRFVYRNPDGVTGEVDVVVEPQETIFHAETAARDAMAAKFPSVDTDDWEITHYRFLGDVEAPAPAP